MKDEPIDMALTFGYEDWAEARDEIIRRLHRVARAQSKITYSELCDELRTEGVIDLPYHGAPLDYMLGHINLLEHERGRPLLSSVVVHKSGDYFPGVGYWNFAKLLGLEVGDSEAEQVKFWAQEFSRCHAYWKNRY